MKKNAFGAIDLLLGLVITSIIFIAMMPMLKDFSTSSPKTEDKQLKNVQQQVDEQVNQIQNAKNQVQQEQDQVNKEYQ
ncbi:MAG: hypothetical protein LKG27_08470 [Clostridiaceae bacterium]|jgi:competence protein ComGC|nr:hypothetical protein [Clostridiaceae bacterium]